MTEERYKIGYIDEDIKQVIKYERRLRDYGFDVIGYSFKKAMSLNDLMEQVYSTDIDLLMIDYKLNETGLVTFNGEKVESDIYDKKPLFPHIIFTNKVEQAEPHIEDLRILYDKTECFDEEGNPTSLFIKTLKRSILQYKNHIKRKKEELANLLEKGENNSLSTLEKDKLVSIQRELKNLYKLDINEVPEHLINPLKIIDLEKTRKEAEDFLQSLIQKNKK